MQFEAGHAADDASFGEVQRVLAQSDLFRAVPAAVLGQVAEAAQPVALKPEEVLMREGDAGDSLYLLLRGRLRLEGRAVRKVVEAPAVLGELALLTGQPRSATATAEVEVVVARLGAEAFEGLREKSPEGMAPVMAGIQRRLEAYQLEGAASVSPLLQGMTAGLREGFLHRLTMERLPSGSVLMHAGEVGEGLYLIVSGRVRVIGDGSAVAELGKGDTVGEMSLMTGERRSATVVALRDSLVARLDRERFAELIAAYPLEMMEIFAGQMAQRSREAAAGKARREKPPVSMAVLGLTAGVEVGAFRERFGRALETFGTVTTLSRETPMVRGVSAASESRLVEWLNDQESHYRHVLYEADGAAMRWTRRCVRQADRVYLVVEANEEPTGAAGRLRDMMEHEEVSGAAKEFELVLLHAEETKQPEKTAAWRAAFPQARAHHHLRMERQDDFERLARGVNGRLVGLTLGGGFALGIAHVGVIRALRELKVPIDCVGGTSMGAVIAAECAMEFPYEPMLDVIVNGCASSLKGDFTLPVLSFLSGAKLGRTLGAYLEKLDVEDFWLPYFSISASLRYAAMRVHDKGDALRSVLASCRAPGMFPPLPWGDDLLVDGGLVNNIPADVMSRFVPGGTVFAVDVSPSEEVAAATGDGLAVYGWSRAKSRWRAKKQKHQPDLTLLDVLGRIVRFGGVNQSQGIRARADCYLVPPLGDFKALDFARGREIADAAYGAAMVEVGAWLELNGRPWARA